MITKAIIPVAGWGTRRLPITKVLEKSMLPVGNRPLVDYAVQELIAAGVKDIYMVISNIEPSQVRAYYSKNPELNKYLEARDKTTELELVKTLPSDVTIHYTVQDPAGKYGTAVPIALVAEKYNLSEPVFVFMGDDFIWNPEGESAAESLIKATGVSAATTKSIASTDDNASTSSQLTSAILGVEIDPTKVSHYGVLSVKNGNLVEIIEKPSSENAPSNLINVSKYIIAPDLLTHIVDFVKQHDFDSAQQEYMITDPISEYIKAGGTMRIAPTTGEFLDGGSVEGWLHANNVVYDYQKHKLSKS